MAVGKEISQVHFKMKSFEVRGYNSVLCYDMRELHQMETFLSSCTVKIKKTQPKHLLTLE